MADDAEKPVRDYRETVFLPETPFPMRAGLPQKEPQILAKWAEENLYHAMRADRQRAVVCLGHVDLVPGDRPRPASR